MCARAIACVLLLLHCVAERAQSCDPTRKRCCGKGPPAAGQLLGFDMDIVMIKCHQVASKCSPNL